MILCNVIIRMIGNFTIYSTHTNSSRNPNPPISLTSAEIRVRKQLCLQVKNKFPIRGCLFFCEVFYNFFLRIVALYLMHPSDFPIKFCNLFPCLRLWTCLTFEFLIIVVKFLHLVFSICAMHTQHIQLSNYQSIFTKYPITHYCSVI